MTNAAPPEPPPAEGRLARLAAWFKQNPLVTAIGVAGSVLGLVKGVPAAWEASMQIAGRPDCFSYAAIYHYPNGQFAVSGHRAWHEQNNKDAFDFKEVNRSRIYILMQNLTPRGNPRSDTMLVRLPVCGGTSQWTYENPQQWTDLYEVWR